MMSIKKVKKDKSEKGQIRLDCKEARYVVIMGSDSIIKQIKTFADKACNPTDIFLSW